MDLNYWYEEYDIANERLVITTQSLRHFFKRHIDAFKDFTFIIFGRGGPTGKTWLSEQLRDMGYKAFDISENISDLVWYVDVKNSCRFDNIQKTVTIVLNERVIV